MTPAGQRLDPTVRDDLHDGSSAQLVACGNLPPVNIRGHLDLLGAGMRPKRGLENGSRLQAAHKCVVDMASLVRREAGL